MGPAVTGGAACELGPRPRGRRGGRGGRGAPACFTCFCFKRKRGRGRGAPASGRPADLISRRGGGRWRGCPRGPGAPGFAGDLREDAGPGKIWGAGRLKHLGGCGFPKTRRSQSPGHLRGQVPGPAGAAGEGGAGRVLRLQWDPHGRPRTSGSGPLGPTRRTWGACRKWRYGCTRLTLFSRS